MSCRFKQFLLVLIAFTLVFSGCSATPSVPETTPTTKASVPPATEATTTAASVQMTTIDDIKYPEILGKPVLGRDQVSELYKADDLQAAAEQITNVGDAMYYIRQNKQWAVPADVCQVFATLIDGDYDAVGFIEFTYTDYYYCLVYVELDGIFYALNPFQPWDIWIHYVKTNYNSSDMNALAEDLQYCLPIKGSNLLSISVSAYNTTNGPSVLLLYDMDYDSIDIAAYPPVFGEPVLGKEKVFQLYDAGDLQKAADQITHIGDALYYILRALPMEDPQSACQTLVSLIREDYDSVGVINFYYTDNYYCLVYVEHDGKFFAFDPFHPTENWIYHPGANFRNSDVNTLAEDLEKALPNKGSQLRNIKVSAYTVDRSKYYYIDAVAYPKELGAPVLGKEKVFQLYEAGNLRDAAQKITHIGDALYYMLRAHPMESPQKACYALSNLVGGDYNKVGYLEFYYADDYDYCCLVYVEHNGKFYAFDPFRSMDNWIYQAGSNFRNSDAQSLAEDLLEIIPNNGSALERIQVTVNSINSNVANVYSYLGTTFPEGLGQPVLTDAQIDELIAQNDFAKIAETITTLPDAVNYYRRAGFTFNEDADMNPHGSLCFAQSAWQVMKDRKGQCLTMSNVNHYLLAGDYDEVGYIEVNSPGDGHIMTYILEDGKYYLVNSVDYTEEQLFDWWENNPGLLWCADDFQKIADSLVSNMRLGDRELVDRVFLVKSPGDFVFARRDNKALYAEGCEAIEYYGFGVTYEKAVLDYISQTRIDY